jgi:hypothetical protein
MLNKGPHYAAIGAALAVSVGGYLLWTQTPSRAAIAATYNPVINPADFVPEINNKYVR